MPTITKFAGDNALDLPEIPGYALKKPLGKGGMAVVYLATQLDNDRTVALKIMAKHLEADPSFGERFLREARICAELSHPNVISIYDVGQHQSYRYMAMECLTGGDLKAKMKKGLKIGDSIDIVKGIAAGLDYAHSKGFIHRDIKPENILFRADGSPVISDFGIARNTDSQTQMTKTGTVIGSPHYMSPEQAEAAPLDSRSDLYSLGIILYELLTGRVPFKGESAISIGIKHITTPPPPLPENVSEFQEFIDRALAKERDDRFQTGAELLAALEAVDAVFSEAEAATIVLSGSATEAMSAYADDKTQVSGAATQINKRKPLQTKRWGAIVAGLAVVILTAGGAWFYQTQMPSAAPAVQTNQEEMALLQKAGIALSESRYYQPPGDNAQYYLTTLLAKYPGSPQAQSALHGLFNTYLREARQALDANDTARANAFLNQSSQITFYIEDQAMLEQLRALRREANTR
ncbi:protein kinase [Litorivivens sp.]|uniref:serine/threonine-protein kinase n=2 Tax=Litorivivens sp. TaxID=2020868 RepID=UPI003567000B